ncbi:RHS repeat-associated core domain protein [Methylocaldum marinum]|uniref:RHS repeat-associated core domain protein n=1 Tax=Methylocaldum marinum TaxID=1432792 RepID=A0A250KMY6_9GAMM|nr:OmpH family outer membrane protein [Methylocaldum marinum]BBA33015.1 RHS repeat-associated core domain protein [Methylocaldum marinum]
MQPYRYSDVRVKGPHGDVISEKGHKITEGRLVIDNGVLAWKRFGDMGKATKGELREADRLLNNLTNDQAVMAQARRQVEMVIEDLTRDLNHKNKATRELADRQLQYFKRMLELF